MAKLYIVNSAIMVNKKKSRRRKERHLRESVAKKKTEKDRRGQVSNLGISTKLKEM